MMRQRIIQYTYSISGQVAAALPLVLVLIFLSRTEGLEVAGAFSVAVGMSSAMFAVALWGLRTSILLDRFRLLGPSTYFLTRVFTLILAGIGTAVSARLIGLNEFLIVGLVLYKICDGIVDLDFGVSQIEVGTKGAMESYMLQHGAKLLLLVAALSFAFFSGSNSLHISFPVAAAVALLFITIKHIRRIIDRFDFVLGLRGIMRLLVSSTWFAIAAFACSVLTSVPRISLAWFYEGDVIGVIGATLSVSTFFGMILQTAWIRYMPQFEQQRPNNNVVNRFLAEALWIGGGLMILSWYVLPQFIAYVFAFDSESQLFLTRQTLMASVIFFLGMNICNLFKVTQVPWMETLSYAIALAVAMTTALASQVMQATHFFLLVAGIAMLVCGLIAAGLLTRSCEIRHVRP